MSPALLPDGVYFGLGEDAYHADPALGSTDLKALYINPVQWQFARLTDLRASIGLGDEADDKESAAKRFGRAVHTMVLEGPDAFEERHCVTPERPKDLLSTVEDLKAAFRDLPGGDAMVKEAAAASGVAMSKWKRDDWVREAREAGLGPLSDDWERDRAAMIGEREEVSARWWATIALIGKMLDTPRESLGGKSQRETVLSGGYPEVSIIATDEAGVRLKARFDYLRIKVSVDVKTFAAQEGREIIDSFAGSVNRYAYDMQAAHYGDMRRRLPELVMAGKVYASTAEDPCAEPTAEHLAFARKAAANPVAGWTWLMVQTVGCPETDIAELPPGSLVRASAEVMVREAKESFARCLAQFGADALWQTDRGLIRMEDIVFSPMITSRGARRWEQAL